MKKSAPGGLTRLTAGCLPVPLFNQKKRTRQPFTSSPGPAASEPQATDFAWEMMMPEEPPLKNMMNPGQSSSAAPHLKQEKGFNPDPLDEPGSHHWSSWRDDSAEAWDRNRFTPQRKSSSSVASAGPRPGLMTLEMNQQRRPSDHAQVPGAQVPGRSSSSNNSSSSLHVVNYNSQQSQLKRKTFGNSLKENTVKEVPGCQLLLKEDDPSLRILPAVIESMKHWKDRAPNCLLLFEVLAVLDSAVTAGAQGAKTFLLRDGKHTVPCVFYEIDRELPRLIRGRVHRCVGSYDPKRGLFKCVSVRPASAAEQNTFQEFVRTADATMSYYTSAQSEM